MDEQENTSQQSFATHKIEISPVFYADATGEPFKNCVMCGKDLLKPDVRYMIEKAFRYDKKNDITETLMEYAICSACHEKIAANLSEESMQRIQEYFSKNLKVADRILLWGRNSNVNDWIGTCAITGKPMGACVEYQMCCECEGDKILLSYLPLMLSEEAMEEMQGLLSEKTKDELDRFRDEFLGIPPEWRELLKEHVPVLI